MRDQIDSNEASAEAPRRLGSYTTARVTRGRVERVERHARRLCRDAKRLGLPLPNRAEVERGLLEAARASFGRGDGIVRVEWSGLPGQPPELTTAARPLDPLPTAWRAASSSATHPGPGSRANTKFVDVEAYDIAREEIRERDVEEMLLFDAAGRLVEGARSNLLVVTEAGRLVTPDLALGGVEGLGLTIVLESQAEVELASIGRSELAGARELMAVNAVRGVVPIVMLDGVEIGSGEAGPWTRRLRALFGGFDPR